MCVSSATRRGTPACAALSAGVSRRTDSAPLLWSRLARSVLLIVLSLSAPKGFGRAPLIMGPQEKTAVKLRWEERRGVSRYRLQLARDARFQNIVFDRVVSGTEYVVADLEPGEYYWRVAPAQFETGRFSTPARVTAGDHPVPLLLAPHHQGWRALTGRIAAPKSLRVNGTMLIVGTDRRGVTYALDARTGAPRWVARPGAESSSVAEAWTLPVTGSDGSRLIVVWDRLVRALDVATGREMWRASLPARATAATGTMSDAPSVLVVTAGPAVLASFDVATGREAWRATLNGEPRALWSDGADSVILLGDGTLERWTNRGQKTHALSVGATTPPARVEARDGSYLVVGTVRGLAALSLRLERVLWEAPLDAVPRGEIAVGGGLVQQRVAWVDREGNLVLFALDARRVEWRKSGASDAYAPLFADVDGDGNADVLAAAGPAFAAAWRGRDGALLWQAEEAMTVAEMMRAPAERSLAVVDGGDGLRYVIASDATGLRAAALPLLAPR